MCQIFYEAGALEREETEGGLASLWEELCFPCRGCDLEHTQRGKWILQAR